MFRAVGGVCLAFGETHFNMLCGVVVVCPMHGVILIFARVDGEANHPSLLINVVGSCINLYGITHIAELH